MSRLTAPSEQSSEFRRRIAFRTAHEKKINLRSCTWKLQHMRVQSTVHTEVMWLNEERREDKKCVQD